MIQKYKFGKPFNTEAVITEIDIEKENASLPIGNTNPNSGFQWQYAMEPETMIFGLGETTRGINKRGFTYTGFCTDDSTHSEDKQSLYGAHNFFMVFTPGKESFGLFFDYPGKITFDMGYLDINTIQVTCEKADMMVYIITPDSEPVLKDMVHQFREIIGQSYIAPRWAFGFQQSRWGYKTEEDIRTVYSEYKKEGIPLDAIYLDIDYMIDYKDFTVNPSRFPSLKKLSDDLKKEGVRLVPIIDAGVKIEKGYDVYEEGVKKGFFCKGKDGTEFVAGVWPGKTHFPDFLNPEARKWFGNKYKILTDMGIEGFWNDMNEPAIFYSEEGIAEVFEKVASFKGKELGVNEFFQLRDTVTNVSNNKEDYKRFYHQVPQEDGTVAIINHNDIHNLYGYNMTRAAGEAFTNTLSPEKRILLFSRSSYIGMHRYGGIWTGDNNSWWQHLLLNLTMMPSLNMCGFLYTGADIGGFGSDASGDLVLRWTALGVFTPLMRNHCCGTRPQECYQFGMSKDFKSVVNLRYALIPYLYSEYMKAVLSNTMYFKPLAFEYENDERALRTENQLLIGNEVMITPVYEQNSQGRYVYLPENMILIRWKDSKVVEQTSMKKGDYFISIPINEVVFFIREGTVIPMAEPELSTDKMKMNNVTLIGDTENHVPYKFYSDDGYTLSPSLEKGIRNL